MLVFLHLKVMANTVNVKYSSFKDFLFEMVYFRSYWSHLDISPTICSHPMAPVGFEPMTLEVWPLFTVPSVRTTVLWKKHDDFHIMYKLIFTFHTIHTLVPQI